MILSALFAATSSPPEPPLLRRTAEQSLAVACMSSAAVRRRRGEGKRTPAIARIHLGEAKSFRGDSPNYNTTNPQTWTLTSVGDWSSWKNFSTTAETRTHGAAHDLTRIGSGTTPATILYDVKGNITQNQRTPGTSSTYQNYVWDFDNRMTSADTNGDNTADVTLEYDALGRRVARTQSATAVVYIHAGQQVICDYTRGANANTTPAFRYVWGDYIDEPILRQTGSSTLLYYHHNQQYSTVALTSASGLVVTRYGYTAYGDQTILSHTAASQTYATYSIRHTYTGREWDDSLKAHYFRARWYDAALGRFVNRDPVGYVDGLSLYRSYLGLRQNDFLGLSCLDNSFIKSGAFDDEKGYAGDWWINYFHGNGATFDISQHGKLRHLFMAHKETMRFINFVKGKLNSFEWAKEYPCGTEGTFPMTFKLLLNYGKVFEVFDHFFDPLKTDLVPLGNTWLNAQVNCSVSKKCTNYSRRFWTCCRTGRDFEERCRNECLNVSCSLNIVVKDKFVDANDPFDFWEGNQELYDGIAYPIIGTFPVGTVFEINECGRKCTTRILKPQIELPNAWDYFLE